jgi:predicted transcriptional regulator
MGESNTAMDLPTPADLKERREALELTQKELADRADVSQPLIARIEGGDVDPRLSTLRRIVSVLDAAGEDVLRAADLMHQPVISVAPDDAVSEAESEMEAAAVSQLPVIRAGVPVGSISHGDVLSAGENVGDQPVSEVMSESFPTKGPAATVDELRGVLEHFEAVVITEGDQPVGIVTQADVAAALS